MTSEATQTVFVVDDDAALRDALATLLEAEGWACETCADGTAFLARLGDWPPDACGCVVLDVLMPGKSGFDVQAHLNARRIDMPVIFITGYGDVPAAVRAMRGGAVDFLTKPFDVQALLQRIRAALQANTERRAARCELEAIRARIATLSPRERQVFERVRHRTGQQERGARLGRERTDGGNPPQPCDAEDGVVAPSPTWCARS